MTLFWAIVFIVLVIAEVLTLQLISIWLAIGALCALISSLFTTSVLAQALIFTISSAALLIITFPLIRKNSKAKKTATNSELNIGENATVIEEINSENGTGRVNLNGVDWMAVSDCIIPAGSTVVVTEIDGAKLKVILKHKEQHINL